MPSPTWPTSSQALASTLAVLRTRLADFETQTDLAASTDYPPGQ